MLIPDCHSGHLNRGGDGSAFECRDGEGECDRLARTCRYTKLMRKYEHTDIIMIDEDTECQKTVSVGIWDNNFTHEAVIVGMGRTGIFEFWLVK